MFNQNKFYSGGQLDKINEQLEKAGLSTFAGEDEEAGSGYSGNLVDAIAEEHPDRREEIEQIVTSVL